MAFKKPHQFSKENLLNNAAPVSSFVSAAPVEMPPPRVAPEPEQAAPSQPVKQGAKSAPKAPQVREGYKKETVIFPLKLSNKIRQLGSEEFKDFSNMTRELVMQALRVRGVSLD